MSEQPLPTPQQLRAFQRDLLTWFSANARDLPWRRKRTPYRVWISELMLQQTRVDQVIPYYQRFLRRFPSLRDLAAAPRADVLKLWEGLGYYSRAVRAHETAKYLMAHSGGSFPRTLEGLRDLPGIGPYTAAAVGSLAMGLDAAVVDGNVLRVLARSLAFSGDIGQAAIRAKLQRVADLLLPAGKGGQFNEAMMELGATVCTPRKPACERCPLSSCCVAREQGQLEIYPVKTKKNAIPHKHVGAGLVVNKRKELLIAQRLESSMLGGLWEFPGGKREPGESMEQCIERELREELGLETKAGAHFMTVRHAFSHFTMDLHVHWVQLVKGRPKPIECADCRWVKPEELSRYAFGRADQKVCEALLRAKRP